MVQFPFTSLLICMFVVLNCSGVMPLTGACRFAIWGLGDKWATGGMMGVPAVIWLGAALGGLCLEGDSPEVSPCSNALGAGMTGLEDGSIAPTASDDCFGVAYDDGCVAEC